jgi:hypothetical protein
MAPRPHSAAMNFSTRLISMPRSRGSKSSIRRRRRSLEARASRKSPFGKDVATVWRVLCLCCTTNSVAHLGMPPGRRYSSDAPFGCGNTPSKPNTGVFALKTFDLLGITMAASAGLCGAALVFSPDASAGGGATCVGNFATAPGGAACVEQMAGLAAPAPVVLPGPVGDGAPPVPLAPPPLPLVPPVGGAPILAAPPAAPLITQAAIGGKGVPANPSLAADPVVRPGPVAAPGPQPTLVTATGPATTP